MGDKVDIQITIKFVDGEVFIFNGYHDFSDELFMYFESTTGSCWTFLRTSVKLIEELIDA